MLIEDRGALTPFRSHVRLGMGVCPGCLLGFCSIRGRWMQSSASAVFASSFGRNCCGDGLWSRALCCGGGGWPFGCCHQLGPSATSTGDGVLREQEAGSRLGLCVPLWHLGGGETRGWGFSRSCLGSCESCGRRQTSSSCSCCFGSEAKFRFSLLQGPSSKADVEISTRSSARLLSSR